MDYCEAVDILEELNGILKHIPYGNKRMVDYYQSYGEVTTVHSRLR